MRFEMYMNEGRSAPVNKDYAKAWIKKHYNPNLTPIYRGVEDMDIDSCYFVEPAKFERESRNTSNYYTLLMDNFKSWKNYPKRSKSIICTTDIFYTNSFGSPNRVIPESRSMIGICPKDDLWISFLRIPLESMSDFNKLLEYIWDISKEQFGYDSYGDLVEHFKLVDNFIEAFYEEEINHYESEEENKDLSRSEIKEMARDAVIDVLTSNFRYEDKGSIMILENIIIKVIDDNDSSIDVIEEIMDPEDNGFKVMNAGLFKISGKHEVWTDAKSLLVPENMMDEMLEDL